MNEKQDYIWTRRDWLASSARTAVNVAAIDILAPRSFNAKLGKVGKSGISDAPPDKRGIDTARAARVAAQSERIDPGPLQALVQRAVDAARSAGADYADARITRTVRHLYSMSGGGVFEEDEELTGVGVRVLVNGYWGFAASPYLEVDEVVHMARDAVGQAKDNGVGSPRTVELGRIPVTTGTWTTPIRIDPFTVSIEEKLDYIECWHNLADRLELAMRWFGRTSWMQFVRQERIVATSEGALFTQTIYESGGHIQIDGGGSTDFQNSGKVGEYTDVRGIDCAGKGWELFLDAKIPEQMPALRDKILEEHTMARGVSVPVGRYTLVCDGATMAALLGATLGIATQLDRALGYEANAGGTSFIDDPLAMVGHLQVASPLVTVTTNRSVPAQIATVKWDDEGVEPPESTLIKDGVLTDFQTTREQASWLAPYYQSQGRPVHSNGCAASESALAITMQHMPNISMEPNKDAIRPEDLVADVKSGIYIEGGSVESDFQARNGTLWGNMRQIINGRLRMKTRGLIQFNSMDIWKHIVDIGGEPSLGGHEVSGWTRSDGGGVSKGQPAQFSSHSIRAVAATILNQPLVDPTKI